jgi:hypothetical protein
VKHLAQDARYRDNFLVVAHPHDNIVENFEFQEEIVDEEPVEFLRYQENTGLWEELPDDPETLDPPPGLLGHRTSILTILPSVDIDCDSDNNDTLERSDWEEEIENEADYPGKLVVYNNDDDNNNSVDDYLENADYDYPSGLSWVPFTDDDLVQVVLDRGFGNLDGMNGFVFELKVTADPLGTLNDIVNSMQDTFDVFAAVTELMEIHNPEQYIYGLITAYDS